MLHKSFPLLTGCVLLATLCIGCVFVDEECDYVETECWDVVDVYCDAWGCWEEVHTECADYCVDAAEPMPAPECTSDRHCPGNDICVDQYCVPASNEHGSAGLCQACSSNSDCAETGALCLNLSAGATTGYCGRVCSADSNCPIGFECLSITGEAARQCVPESQQGERVCDSIPAPDDCYDDEDCLAPFVCEDGECVAPETIPDCTTSAQCDDGEICIEGYCLNENAECVSIAQCDADEHCVDNLCIPEDDECIDEEQCGDGESCVDGECVVAPPECTGTTGCDDGEECVDGTCVPITPECVGETGCDEGWECVDGACVEIPPECVGVTGCDEGEECVEGVCQAIEIECERNLDCPDDGLCVDGSCRNTCDTVADCPGDQVCRAGLCSPPPEPECQTGADCVGEGDFYCVNGSCRPECSNDDECDFGYFCRGFYCDIDTSIECRSTLECGLDERCVEGECLVECAASCNCPDGLSCDPDGGVCIDLPVPDSCVDDCECPGGYQCVENACQIVEG